MRSAILRRVSTAFHGSVACVQTKVESLLPEQEEGQGMIEYGLIIAFISIAAIAILVLFKAPLQNLFSNVVSTLG